MIKYNEEYCDYLMHMGLEHALTVKPMTDIVNLTGKNAIVTGGTTGLGYAVTNRLALAGAKVVICGRTKAKGEIAEKQFRERGLDVTYCQADITFVSECEKLVKFCEDTYGPVDILVNNAARWIHHSLVDQEEEMYGCSPLRQGRLCYARVYRLLGGARKGWLCILCDGIYLSFTGGSTKRRSAGY